MKKIVLSTILILSLFVGFSYAHGPGGGMGWGHHMSVGNQFGMMNNSQGMGWGNSSWGSCAGFFGGRQGSLNNQQQ